jgi:signal transduction histidine kinase
MRITTRLLLWYVLLMLALALVVGVPSYRRLSEGAAAEGGQARGSAACGEASRGTDPGDGSALIGRIVIPAVLTVLAGGWWLTRRGLAPIRALTAALERTNERHLGERLPRSGNGDEIDRLTEVFNAMSARLDESFRRVRDFTLHASHELKTPLTVLRGEIETASHDETLPPAERERLAGQLDEIQRLAAIVDSLALLTRADAGLVQLAHDPVRLDELIRETVEDLQHLAAGRDITVAFDRCEAVTVAGDRHRLRQLLLNLADNAVKHNHPGGGQVSVSLRRIGTTAEAVISNTGAGLPRALNDRVFERFFRGDPSHGSAVDGSGLGLSIVKWIAEAHGGSVRFVSDTGCPTTVTVVLPALHI